MPKEFRLHGDILYPATVIVEAENVDEAIELAEQGRFSIYDVDQSKCAQGFHFDYTCDDDNCSCAANG